MALRYLVKARARREIERAAEWWAIHRPAASGAVRMDVDDAIHALCHHPGLGTKVDTGRVPPVRRLLLDRTKYWLYYRVHEDALEVIAVWHSSREHGPEV